MNKIIKAIEYGKIAVDTVKTFVEYQMIYKQYDLFLGKTSLGDMIIFPIQKFNIMK